MHFGKSKVLVVKKDERGSCEKVRVNGEEKLEANNFKYLRMMISTGGGSSSYGTGGKKGRGTMIT